MKASKPNLVMFNAHGTPKYILGFKEPMLMASENEHLTNGLVIYARTCSSAAELGKNCYEKGGAKAFVGYSWYFTFLTDNNNEARPLADEDARPVLETSNVIVEALLKGNTIHEAVTRSAQHMEKEIDYIKSSKFPNYLDAPLVIGCLKLNHRILKVYGDEKARIF